jgi:hypothetical protein
LADHFFKAATLYATCSGLTQVIIDYLDLIPSQIVQSVFHSILKQTALFVTDDLMRRGLSNIEDCHSPKMLTTYFFIHFLPPLALQYNAPEGSGRSTSAPAGQSRFAAPRWAAASIEAVFGEDDTGSVAPVVGSDLEFSSAPP